MATTKKETAKTTAVKTETKATAKKAPVKKTATTTKTASTKKTPVKKTKKETTVVMTIEATFILKAGQTPDSINLTEICPSADHINMKKMQVFEKDE